MVIKEFDRNPQRYVNLIHKYRFKKMIETDNP